MIKLSGFTWSTEEQVWPFEKDTDNSPLYCKFINGGLLPDSGQINVVHNISSLKKVYRLEGMAVSSIYGGQWQPMPRAGRGPYDLDITSDLTYIYVANSYNYGSAGFYAHLYIIYSKL